MLLSEDSKLQGDLKKQKKEQTVKKKLSPQSTEGQCRGTYQERVDPNKWARCRWAQHQKDYEIPGLSTECLACEWRQDGLHGLIGSHKHTELCRQRMEEAMTVQSDLKKQKKDDKAERQLLVHFIEGPLSRTYQKKTRSK